MATFQKYTYTNNGTEIDFFQGLYDAISALGTGITLEDSEGNVVTFADIYSDLTVQTTFYINFGGGSRMSFVRPSVPTQTTSHWVCNSRNLILTNSSVAYNTQAARSVMLILINTDTFIYVSIGNYNASALTGTSATTVTIKNNGVIYTANFSGYTVVNQQFKGSDNSIVYLAKLFPFVSSAGSIDYSLKTPLCSGGAGGTKVFDTRDICSCTTVAVEASMALPNGKNYYAIDTNWMIEVEPST